MSSFFDSVGDVADILSPILIPDRVYALYFMCYAMLSSRFQSSVRPIPIISHVQIIGSYDCLLYWFRI